MKRYIRNTAYCLSILYLFFTSCQALAMQQQRPSLAEMAKALVPSSMSEVNLISKNGQVNKNLLEFLDLYGFTQDGTVASVDQVMQKHFLRKPGLERCDLSDNELDHKVKEKALVLLKKMGFVDEIPCSEVKTDYFLLFGAMMERIAIRFSDLVQQYTQGTLRCKNIVLLGGYRKLRPHEVEPMEKELGEKSFSIFLNQLVKKDKEELTEPDLFRFMWTTRVPKEMQEAFQEGDNLFFVNSNDITDPTEKGNNRATTKTTIEEWLTSYQPEPGSCHANTEKPYGVRMEKLLRLLLEKKSQSLHSTDRHFSITWNSPKAPPSLLLSVYKDELARAFRVEIELRRFYQESTHEIGQ